MKRYAAEFFGTFWLVLGGCGSAVLAAAFPGLGIGFHSANAFVLSLHTARAERALARHRRRAHSGEMSAPGDTGVNWCNQR